MAIEKKRSKLIRVITSKARSISEGVQKGLDTILYRCRILYNAALQERKDSYKKLGKSPTYFDQCKELTEIRGQDPDYRNLDVTMVRVTALQRLDRAFKSFFKRCKDRKPGDKVGYPRFKGRNRFSTISFGLTGWKLTGNKLWISGIGQIRLTSVPEIQGEIKGLQLIKKSCNWFVHFIVDQGEAPVSIDVLEPVGIDVGLKTFVTLSDGSTIENPRFVRESLEKLAFLNQDLARKKLGSNRRRRSKLRLSRFYEKIANRRKDFLHKTTRKLVKVYDGFAVEDLDIQGMVDSDRSVEGMTEKGERGLRRGIMDAAWGTFFSYLAYKAEEAGKLVKKVLAKGTSQRCSSCGSLVRKTMRDRSHICPCCGLEIDRDLNAAINIHNLGWRLMEDRSSMECP
jgi:putative transposase